jgi:CRP/FNR family transcriptional regulator
MRSFFLRELSRRYCALHSQIELRTPIDRLARFLLARCAGAGEVACTQEEIAEAVGVTRETVNRHLARLQDKGVLKVGRGSIRIVDAEGLKGIPGFRVGLISMI